MIASLRQRITSFILDKNFNEIFIGSIWSFSAQVAAMALGLITSVMIARLYGAEMVGIVAITQAFLLLATITTVLGTNTSILRLIPEHISKYSASSAFFLYRKTQYLVAVVSIAVGTLLFVASRWIAQDVFGKPYLAFYFGLASCFVVFRSLMDLNTQAVRGLRLIKLFAFMQVLPSAAVLFFLITFTYLSVGQNSPVYAQMIAWACTAMIGVVLMHFHFRKKIRGNDVVHPMSLRELLRISSPMMMTAAMTFLLGQTGVILLGVFRTETEVGLYAIAVKLATLTSFLLAAINSMAAPKFSELFHKGELNELFYIARKSTKLIFWSTLPILFVLIVLGEMILKKFYGADFSIAYPAMMILIAGQLVNSMSGSTGNFMNMTGNEKQFRNIVIGAGLVNVALSLTLIPRFGILGAAASASVCVVIWNVCTLVYIKQHYGRSIGYIPFLLGPVK